MVLYFQKYVTLILVFLCEITTAHVNTYLEFGAFFFPWVIVVLTVKLVVAIV
jgi:hypothetical protein